MGLRDVNCLFEGMSGEKREDLRHAKWIFMIDLLLSEAKYSQARTCFWDLHASNVIMVSQLP